MVVAVVGRVLLWVCVSCFLLMSTACGGKAAGYHESPHDAALAWLRGRHLGVFAAVSVSPEAITMDTEPLLRFFLSEPLPSESSKQEPPEGFDLADPLIAALCSTPATWSNDYRNFRASAAEVFPSSSLTSYELKLSPLVHRNGREAGVLVVIRGENGARCFELVLAHGHRGWRVSEETLIFAGDQ